MYAQFPACYSRYELSVVARVTCFRQLLLHHHGLKNLWNHKSQVVMRDLQEVVKALPLWGICPQLNNKLAILFVPGAHKAFLLSSHCGLYNISETLTTGTKWEPLCTGDGVAQEDLRSSVNSLSARQTVLGQIEVLAILFAVVARGTTILAKHAWCGGNFLEVTEQILAKIPSENNKLTYSHGNYLFHYICQDRIVYLCITDDDFERSRAFSFLNEGKKRFQTTYGSIAQTALPYAMNSELSSVLAAQLKHRSENKSLDKGMETQAQADELKGVMVRNIDLVAQRGERSGLLIDKTENLVDSSVTFKTTSRNLARAMCMKNIKLTITIIIVSIVFIHIIGSPICGGFTWPSCVKE
ncbi:vesicle-associated membrane protein 7-like [Mus caroli]|uniref:Vesicle-associated membrane protein 7 n=1 Tax=Mus caroli TaxID=10089 RepID=A0A6P7PTF0_MUSCR|nr:vesicle-associated membrane protein 7-like [Mus caroli]